MSRTRGSVEISSPDAAASAGLVGPIHLSNADGRPKASGNISSSGRRAFLYGNLVILDEGIEEDVLLACKSQALSAFISHPALVKARIGASRVFGDNRTTHVNLLARRRLIDASEIDVAA